MGKIQTTEQTGKLWKFLQMIGVLGILGCATFGMISQNVDTTAKCLLVGIPASGLWVFGRVGAWWFHG